jgi:hypothetical protein
MVHFSAVSAAFLSALCVLRFAGLIVTGKL